MKKISMLIIPLMIIIAQCKSQESVKISGRVTDFDGNPLDSAAVRLKNKNFENVYDTIDIAPLQIKKDELQVWVNDIPSEVVNITKTYEYARGAYMIGYFIQIMKPEDAMKTEQEYDKISIILDSKETGDTGKGECFVKRVQ